MTSDEGFPAKHTATLSGAAWLGAAHLVVDAVCVTAVLRASPPSDSLAASALAFVLGYDVLAFAGQTPFGWLIDRFDLRRGSALFGLLLTTLALLAGARAGITVLLLAGAGNALFHVGAGAMVLAGSRERAAPAGVFVAPGALGLGLGLLLGRKFLTVPVWPWLFALAAACLVVLLVSIRTETAAGASPIPAALPFHRREILFLVSLLCLSVAVRSLVGTVGCDACPRTLLLATSLPIAAFAGKLVGGFLADRFGWIELAMIALLASGPLLAFGGGDLWLVLPGVVLLQMTMPVTLSATLRLMPGRPAFGFGLLCLALVAGTLPAYLPGGWRPRGVPLLLLVLGSAAVLFLALRPLLPRGQRRSGSSSVSANFPSVSPLCGGSP